jgi:FtsP/CotA-like multicopper oxidase with cupredoxin domain
VRLRKGGVAVDITKWWDKWRWPVRLMGVVLLAMQLDGTALAGDRPVAEFTVVVQEKTIKLLENPQKVVTVWAFGLEGQEATVPGPVIRVQKGTLVRIHFKNTHVLPHSMHFHGVHPFNMDGNGVRKLGKEQLQMPGESYTYEWTPAEPGYYLYHCHFDTLNHMDHGMYGFFIVEDSAWPSVDREMLTIWDEWDTDGDGRYDTHTINTRSAPDQEPLTARVGEKVRLVMANVGSEVHAPHLHGVMWMVIDPSDLKTPLSNDSNGVISLAAAQIKAVEFEAPDPGTWLFHCHVLPHVADDGLYDRGMLTTLNVTKKEPL